MAPYKKTGFSTPVYPSTPRSMTLGAPPSSYALQEAQGMGYFALQPNQGSRLTGVEGGYMSHSPNSVQTFTANSLRPSPTPTYPPPSTSVYASTPTPASMSMPPQAVHPQPLPVGPSTTEPIPIRQSNMNASGNLSDVSSRLQSLSVGSDSTMGPNSAPMPAPPPPPVRQGTESKDLSDTQTVPSIMSSDEEEEEEEEIPMTATNLPDLTHVNRAPPVLDPPRHVPFNASISAATIFRDQIAVVTHDKIRVLQVRPGAQFDKTVSDPSTERIIPQALQHHALLGTPQHPSATSRDIRALSLTFCPPIIVDGQVYPEGRFVWYGTYQGHIGQIDTAKGQVTHVRVHVHKSPIILLERLGHSIICVDDSGKVSLWSNRTEPHCLITSTPEMMRIDLPKQSHVSLAGALLWVCTVALAPRMPGRQPQKTLYVRCYSPLTDKRPFNMMLRPGEYVLTDINGLGGVTCSAFIPSTPNHVYFGHDSGHISVWTTQGQCVDQVPVHSEPIVSMTGVFNALWTGSRSGKMKVNIPGESLRDIVKLWPGHRGTVTHVLFDGYGQQYIADEPVVCTVGEDNYAKFWDATLTSDWLSNEVSRSAEIYSKSHSLRVLSMTYNLAAASPEDIFGLVDNMGLFQRILRSSCASQTTQDGKSVMLTPDVIVFAFQELIDLEDKRMTAKRFIMGHNKKKAGKETEERERMPSHYRAWLEKLISYVRLVMPETPFSVVVTENMIGLFTCIFVRSSLVPRIREVHSYTVKTGLGGRYGNKGAIISRFLIDDSSFCFINCHLAAGQRKVRQRNMDVATILQSTSTAQPLANDPAFAHGGDGLLILDHELCLMAGDFNYRLNMRRELVLSLIEQKRFSDLVAVDQLHDEIRNNPAFRLRLFQEAPIQFAPTYKFNRFSNVYDTSDKARVPAYCDRILYHGYIPSMVQCTSYRRWDATLSDHRPVSATFLVRIKSIDDTIYSHVLEKTRADFLRYREELIESCCRYYHCI